MLTFALAKYKATQLVFWNSLIFVVLAKLILFDSFLESIIASYKSHDED